MDEYSGGLLSEHRFQETDKRPVIVAEPMEEVTLLDKILEFGEQLMRDMGIQREKNPPTNPLAKTFPKYGEPSPRISER